MGDLESDEGLPEGWRVEVRERKNGRKDKRYFPPSGNCIFSSKLEVLRYLEKEKGNTKKSSKNVALEKAEPEGLPPGWTKEVKVTKKGGKIRRDSFYTDPASGYIFHSLKDVRRYLETGEIGRLAKKPKEKGNDESDPKTSLPAVAKKENLEVVETTILSITDKRTKPCETRNGEQITGDSISVCSQVPRECRKGKEKSQTESPNDDNSDQIEEKTDSSKSTLVSTPEVGALQTKQRSPETAVASGKTKKEKNINQPRRSSKRLAGVPVDPTPELKSMTRANRAVVKECSEMVAGNSDSSSADQGHPFNVKTTNQGNQVVVKQLNKEGDSSSGNGSSSVNKSECTNNFSSESSATGNYKRLEDMVKPEYLKEGSFVLPVMDFKVREQNEGNDSVSLGEFWQDPCIAFAIKTLTGASVDLNTNHGSIVPPVSSHSRLNISKPQQEAAMGASSISAKADKKPESTIELPVVADILADPCIEFAVKTLTGAIPLDYMPLQGYMSSESSGVNGKSATRGE